MVMGTAKKLYLLEDFFDKQNIIDSERRKWIEINRVSDNEGEPVDVNRFGIEEEYVAKYWIYKGCIYKTDGPYTAEQKKL